MTDQPINDPADHAMITDDDLLDLLGHALEAADQIGRASCRERVFGYV